MTKRILILFSLLAGLAGAAYAVDPPYWNVNQSSGMAKVPFRFSTHTYVGGYLSVGSTTTAAAAPIHVYTNSNLEWLRMERSGVRSWKFTTASKTYNSGTTRYPLKIQSDLGSGCSFEIDDYGFVHICGLESNFTWLTFSASTGPALRTYGDQVFGDTIYFGASDVTGTEVLRLGVRADGAFNSRTYIYSANELNKDSTGTGHNNGGGAFFGLMPDDNNQGSDRGNVWIVGYSSTSTGGGVVFKTRSGVDTLADRTTMDQSGNWNMGSGTLTSSTHTVNNQLIVNGNNGLDFLDVENPGNRSWFGRVTSNDLYFYSNFAGSSAPILYMQSNATNGRVGFGTSSPGGQIHSLAPDNGIAGEFQINATQANVTGADTFLSFNSTTGQEGSVTGTAAAGVLIFNTFTGAHWTMVRKFQTAAEIQDNVLAPICSTGERFTSQMMWDAATNTKTRKRVSSKEQLVRSEPCAEPYSRAVLGFYGGRNADTGYDYALALGTGLAWVLNTGEAVEPGDWLVTSGDGTTVQIQMDRGGDGKRKDDVQHAYSAAKALQKIQWKPGEKKRKIAVTYHAG